MGPPTGMHPALTAVGFAFTNFPDATGCFSTKFL